MIMQWYDWVALITGIVSAVLWFFAAGQDMSTGFGGEQTSAQKLGAKLNASAAFCTALSLIFSNFEKLLKLMG